MRLKTVTLKNFRCFETLTLELHPRLTVIVGENGAGKTAVLDGIASGLTPVLSHLSSANQRLTGRGIKDADFRIQSITGARGKEQWSVADYAQIMTTTQENLRWDYWRPSSGGKGKEPEEKWGETALKERLNAISASYKTSTPVLTPVFAYYGASRGHIEVPERLRSIKNDYEHPTSALVDCFNPNSDFREMLAWFDLEESSELRENKDLSGEDYMPFSSLEAVRATVVSLRFRQFASAPSPSLGAFCFGAQRPSTLHSASPLGVPAWRSSTAATIVSIGSSPTRSAIRAWSSGGHGFAPLFHWLTVIRLTPSSSPSFA